MMPSTSSLKKQIPISATHFTQRLFLILVIGSLVGCSSDVYIGPSMAWETRHIPKPEGTWTPAITAASDAVFSGDRNRALTIVAKNPEITEAEQTYLLAIVRKLQGFSGDTSKVLIELARNPASTDGTRTEIASLVGDLSLFSSDAAKVSAALAETR